MLTCDLHSHLLPAIDDGAKNVTQTAEILRGLLALGVVRLGLTPHFYPREQSLSSFLNQRKAAYEALMQLPEASLFRFSLGAEVYFTEQLFNYEDFSPLCYENTSFLLVELETRDKFTSAMERNLLRLVEDRRTIPILAHIDRYPFLTSDEKLLFHLRQMGCMFQMNVSTFSSFFERRKLLSLANKGFLDFFGQDLHRSLLPESVRRKSFSYLLKKGGDLMKKTEENAKRFIFS